MQCNFHAWSLQVQWGYLYCYNVDIARQPGWGLVVHVDEQEHERRESGLMYLIFKSSVKSSILARRRQTVYFYYLLID
jgi:hypothetical protein